MYYLLHSDLCHEGQHGHHQAAFNQVENEQTPAQTTMCMLYLFHEVLKINPQIMLFTTSWQKA